MVAFADDLREGLFFGCNTDALHTRLTIYAPTRRKPRRNLTQGSVVEPVDFHGIRVGNGLVPGPQKPIMVCNMHIRRSQSYARSSDGRRIGRGSHSHRTSQLMYTGWRVSVGVPPRGRAHHRE